MITVQLLVGNDENRIVQTLDSIRESLRSLNPEILIGDTGSEDGTISICLRKRCRVIPTPLPNHTARNQLLDLASNDWNLSMKPGEVLLDAQAIVQNHQKPITSRVIQGGVLTQEARLQDRNQYRFINPVFERWNCKSGEAEILIASPSLSVSNREIDLVNSWVSNSPTESAAIYHRACIHLSQKNYDEFLKDAEKYFFMETRPSEYLPITLMRYYTSMTYCYVRKDFSLALQHSIPCIAANPFMAEFWCLVGDAQYYLAKNYRKSALLYRNAIDFGNKRLRNDQFPMEIAKYKDYPESMIESCEKIIESSVKITANR